MQKKSVLLLCVLIVLLAQCSTFRNSPLQPTNLPSQLLTIDVTRDTTLRSSKGAIITIPAGAISADDGKTITLEVKEAYSMADMIKAGLTTQAGKEPLSSGGMFYLAPTAGSKGKVKHPITVQVPTSKQVEGMQLYKGEKTSENTINWTDPTPLPTQELNPIIAAGKALYNSNCASCHHPTTEATGPPLALLNQRRDSAWLVDFVHNPSELISKGDLYSNIIYLVYNKTQMTSFPDLTAQEIHAIFEYCNEQAVGIDPATIPDYKKSYDSCEHYLHLRNYYEGRKASLIGDNGNLVDAKYVIDSTQIVALNSLNTQLNNDIISTKERFELIEPTNPPSEYYKVNIDTFGWFNVDILTKNLPGFEQSVLTVKLAGTFKGTPAIYLAIPDLKILISGGLMKGQNNTYCFYADDGTAPLPQGKMAFIISIGEQEGQLFFGNTPFAISREQALDLSMSNTTPEQMTLTIEKLNMPDFKFNVSKSKNADSILSINQLLKKLELMKPHNCECPFYFPNFSGEIYEVEPTSPSRGL
jgi:mono/diheme cytochrome c family protein